VKEYISNLKEIRLWIDEEIGLPFYNGNLVDYETQIITEAELDEKDLSIEYFLPRRHVSNYGCLSMRYVPNQTGTLKISINSFNKKDTILEDRLSYSYDRITLGINVEYTEAMMDYIIMNEITRTIPSGNLDFYTGANSEIGSSIMSNLFAVEILLNLLPLNEYIFDEKHIEEFINKCISLCKIKYAKRKEYNNKEKQKNW